MKIGIAQLNYTVGDFSGNAQKILGAYKDLVSRGAEVVATSELAIFGYPPKDLLELPEKIEEQNVELRKLCRHIGFVPLLVGVAEKNSKLFGKELFNAAFIIRNGVVVGKRRKSLLPNYDVFDEERYFQSADDECLGFFPINGRRVATLICEDVWNGRADSLARRSYAQDPIFEVTSRAPEFLIVLNASPYYWGKGQVRFDLVSDIAKRMQCSVIYVNQVGGNDELIFDGRSFGVDRLGHCFGAAQSFEEDCAIFDTEKLGFAEYVSDREGSGGRRDDGELYRALVLGVRDYFRKTGNTKAVIALSGGIDSALTACIAVDALGAGNVMGVAMPSDFSSEGSIVDARTLACNLGIRFELVPIASLYEVFGEAIISSLGWRSPENFGSDTTEENVQARLRGAIIMAFSNREGSLVLTTGNKSELAVGYCTLYGDMAGGLAVISDVPKTIVYRLARYVNYDRDVIPRSTIEKQPSAELRPGQVDEDSLPPYEILDAILRLYVEERFGLDRICAHGFDRETVRQILSKVDRNEYKRRQAAIGLKVTSLAFGSGRRYPIAMKH